jgi:hypothetical protein
MPDAIAPADPSEGLPRGRGAEQPALAGARRLRKAPARYDEEIESFTPPPRPRIGRGHDPNWRPGRGRGGDRYTIAVQRLEIPVCM